MTFDITVAAQRIFPSVRIAKIIGVKNFCASGTAPGFVRADVRIRGIVPGSRPDHIGFRPVVAVVVPDGGKSGFPLKAPFPVKFGQTVQFTFCGPANIFRRMKSKQPVEFIPCQVVLPDRHPVAAQFKPCRAVFRIESQGALVGKNGMRDPPGPRGRQAHGVVQVFIPGIASEKGHENFKGFFVFALLICDETIPISLRGHGPRHWNQKHAQQQIHPFHRTPRISGFQILPSSILSMNKPCEIVQPNKEESAIPRSTLRARSVIKSPEKTVEKEGMEPWT